MSYEVGAVASLSGVTVRTLHHYDRIGLLRPSDRTPAGYRLYDEDDLERLQRILFYRELGFDLDRIRQLMAGDRTIGLSQMREQHRLLRLRIARLELDDWFYPCSAEMHAGLAEMYIAGPRFTKTFEAMAPGLAQYVHDAFLANSKR